MQRPDFMQLIQPCAGVVRPPTDLHPANWIDRVYSLALSRVGSLSAVYPGIYDRGGLPMQEDELCGAGAHRDPAVAHILATAEAAERYASCIALESELTVASADELGDAAIPWRRFAKVGSSERSDGVRPFDPSARIRWVQGISLRDGRTRYVPLTYACLFPQPWSSERFTSPISTGVAAHTNVLQAVLSGLLEVIERDALSLAWLLRVPLRRIRLSGALGSRFERECTAQFGDGEQFHFFDATTDIGVPTVYLLRRRPGHPAVSQLVTCSTEFSCLNACEKAARESASTSFSFEVREIPPPASPDHCVRVWDGAAYLGRPQHESAFRFLLDSCETCEPEAVGSFRSDESTESRLRSLVERLAALDMEPVAIELTTDDLLEVGLRVVRVVVPELMPFSSVHGARYLGHPRLLQYARHCGLEGLSELDVNPDPQPFA